MSDSGFEQAVALYHAALTQLIQGDPVPQKERFSHQDDVTLANPFGPVVRGWDRIEAVLDQVATLYSSAGSKAFERVVTCVTQDLAFIVEVERANVTLRGHQADGQVALRVTTVFRPEAGTWRVVHRHADTITTFRTVESVLP